MLDQEPGRQPVQGVVALHWREGVEEPAVGYEGIGDFDVVGAGCPQPDGVPGVVHLDLFGWQMGDAGERPAVLVGQQFTGFVVEENTADEAVGMGRAAPEVPIAR